MRRKLEVQTINRHWSAPTRAFFFLKLPTSETWLWKLLIVCSSSEDITSLMWGVDGSGGHDRRSNTEDAHLAACSLLPPRLLSIKLPHLTSADHNLMPSSWRWWWWWSECFLGFRGDERRWEDGVTPDNTQHRPGVLQLHTGRGRSVYSLNEFSSSRYWQ